MKITNEGGIQDAIHSLAYQQGYGWQISLLFPATIGVTQCLLYVSVFAVLLFRILLDLYKGTQDTPFLTITACRSTVTTGIL